MRKSLYAVALFCSIAACSNELSGQLKVDGNAFEMDSCRSGEVYGFVGVEIKSKKGAKLRVAQAPTGEAVAFFIPAGKTTGVEVGVCGEFEVSEQSSTINNVHNVEGKANLACEAAGHKIQGKFSFGNCH